MSLAPSGDMHVGTEDFEVVDRADRLVLTATKRPAPPAPKPVEAASRPVEPAARPVVSPSVARRFLTTVLFIDVVDSTRHAVELGDSEWLSRQESHESMVRREIARFAGRCLVTVGDGVVAAFSSAAAGVRCAAAIAEASRALGIDVRTGLHSGDCERRGRRLGGIVFHVGARVMSAAAAGEVLVSRTVTELVAGGNFVFSPRGTHRLKGLPGEWDLYALVGRRPGTGDRRPPA